MKRLEWVDNAKGIGILLVIVAHVINHVSIFLPVSTVIYTFHMPLFFILSGYTLSERTMSFGIRQLIIKYAKTLGIPYFFFTFLNMLASFVFFSNKTLLFVAKNAYHLIFLHGWKATWFLPALFFALIIAIVMIRRFHNVFLLFFVTFTFSVGMTYLGPYLPDAVKALSLGIIAVPFVVFGYMMHMDSVRKITESRIAPFISAAVIVLSAIVNGKVDFVWYQFGRSSIIWLVSGIVGSQIIFHLAKRIHLPIINRIGRGSLIIMCIHQFIMFGFYAVIHRFTHNAYIQFSLLLAATLLTTLLLYPFAERVYSTLFSRFRD